MRGGGIVGMELLAILGPTGGEVLFALISSLASTETLPTLLELGSMLLLLFVGDATGSGGTSPVPFVNRSLPV